MIVQRLVAVLLLATTSTSAAASCDHVLQLNHTGSQYVDPIRYSYTAGQVCQLKLLIPQDQFASFYLSTKYSDGANASIIATNSVNDSFPATQPLSYYFPPPVADINIHVTSGNITISLYSLTVLTTAESANVTQMYTAPGQQATTLEPWPNTVYTINSATGVSMNVLPYLVFESDWAGVFVYDGAFPDGKLIGTLYTFRSGQMIRSSGKLLSVFCYPKFLYPTLLVNDATNVDGFSSAVVAESEMLGNLGIFNTTLDASSGPAVLTMVYPYHALEPKTVLPYVLSSAQFSDSSASLEVYSGSPIPSLTNKPQYLATYTSENVVSTLPQLMNLAVASYQLNSGSCKLVFTGGYLSNFKVWNIVNATRNGFLTTSYYPFLQERQQISTWINSTMDRTRFTFTVKSSNVSVSLFGVDPGNNPTNYTLSSSSGSVVINAPSVLISVQPQNISSTGALVQYTVTQASSRKAAMLALIWMLFYAF